MYSVACSRLESVLLQFRRAFDSMLSVCSPLLTLLYLDKRKWAVCFLFYVSPLWMEWIFSWMTRGRRRIQWNYYLFDHQTHYWRLCSCYFYSNSRTMMFLLNGMHTKGPSRTCIWLIPLPRSQRWLVVVGSVAKVCCQTCRLSVIIMGNLPQWKWEKNTVPTEEEYERHTSIHLLSSSALPWIFCRRRHGIGFPNNYRHTHTVHTLRMRIDHGIIIVQRRICRLQA